MDLITHEEWKIIGWVTLLLFLGVSAGYGTFVSRRHGLLAGAVAASVWFAGSVFLFAYGRGPL
jgi:CHASE2 domain-containing sensor protein